MNEIIRQQSPSADRGSGNTYRPEELNADLALAALTKDIVNKLPTPSRVTKKFTVIHGLMKSLNHDEKGEIKNLTYIDTSGLVNLMGFVNAESVNEDGWYIEHLFGLLAKPKLILQGLGTTTPQQENKPGIVQRILGWGKKDNQQGQQQ